jgi:hypothetical protein
MNKSDPSFSQGINLRGSKLSTSANKESRKSGNRNRRAIEKVAKSLSKNALQKSARGIRLDTDQPQSESHQSANGTRHSLSLSSFSLSPWILDYDDSYSCKHARPSPNVVSAVLSRPLQRRTWTSPD